MKICNWHLRKKHIALCSFFALVAWIAILLIIRTPSNDRQWSTDQALLPYAVFKEDIIYVKNIRNFRYTSRDVYTLDYYDKTVSINDIESVDYIVEPLASIAAAHTLLSFGLKDGSRIAISVEIRKEVNEEFSPLKGVFEEYEIMYVVVDEQDALTLRAVHRDNPVYIYPTIASAELAQQLFVHMLQQANQLKEQPEFYNTLTNTCATKIVDHVNEIVPGKIGWDYRIFLPKESDALAYELGLLDVTKTLKELRTLHDATDKIKTFANSEDFSTAIRLGQTTTDLDQ